MKRVLWYFVLCAVVVVSCCSVAFCDDYSSWNSGGISVRDEARSSASYRITDSIGQCFVDVSSSSESLLESGYWHAERSPAGKQPNFNSGGISASPRASAHYHVLDSIGQFTVDSSASTDYCLQSGYWYSDESVPTLYISINGAKSATDGEYVQLGSPDKPVVVSTYRLAFGSRFYVEEPDRSAGIAVKLTVGSSNNLIPGDRIWLVGNMTTIDGERAIINAIPAFLFHGQPIDPLAMIGRSLGGSDPGSQIEAVFGARGLGNVGLLVRVAGRVGQTDPSGSYFYLDDGSGLLDGTLTGGAANAGVRVGGDGRDYTPAERLVVTGISSCFKDDAGRLQRRLRPISIRVEE